MKTILISASFACMAMYGCSSGTVTSVKIETVRDSGESGPDIRHFNGKPIKNLGFSGTTLKLKAMLEATGRIDSAVVWSIKDGSSGSNVTQEGVLNISKDMSDLMDTLTVTATSKQTPEVSGNLKLTIVHDANPYNGKWARDWKSYKDTIIIEDDSYTVKVSNGNSYSVTETKWLLFSNGDFNMKADYPDVYWMNGVFNKVKGKQFFNSYIDGLKSGETIRGLQFSISKDKSKLGVSGLGSSMQVYDRIK
jgi:hypothetical protein